jgi:chorismate mutase
MEISDWRRKIDDIDEQIVRLISERAAAAQAIGELKQKGNLPIYEPRREQEVFEHVRSKNNGPLTDIEMQDIFERIIDVMRGVQRHGGK